MENLKPLRVVELLDGADQAEVALLDQVEEQHPAAHVALRDRDHQAQVRLDQLALGELAVALDAVAASRASRLGLGAVALRDLVAADALDLAEGRRAGGRGSPRPSRRPCFSGFGLRLVVLAGRLQRGGELAGLDPARQVDLLGGVEERDLADLLEVHPHRIVRRRPQQVDLDARPGWRRRCRRRGPR